MIVICDKCNTKYKLDDSIVTEDGAKVRCSKCGNTFIVKKPRVEDIQKITTQSSEEDNQKTVLQTDIHSDLDKAINETISDITGQLPKEQDAGDKSGNEFDWSALSEEKKEPVKEEPAGEEPAAALEWTPEEQGTVKPEPEELKEPADKGESVIATRSATLLDYKEPEISTTTVEHAINESVKHNRFENISNTLMPVIKKIIISFITIIVLTVAGYYAYMYRTELLDIGHGIYLNISKYTTSTEPVNIGVSVSDSKGYFLKNVRGQQLFVIEGNVTNATDRPMSFIKLTANISDNNNNLIASRTFYAANILTDDELRTLTSDQINSKINNEMGQSLKNFNVAPKTSLPFMVVFFDVPDNLTSFTVIPTSAHNGVQ
jgi:predicted Zn finger-like uncharacterized protein